jgi:hypothetical protein
LFVETSVSWFFLDVQRLSKDSFIFFFFFERVTEGNFFLPDWRQRTAKRRPSRGKPFPRGFNIGFFLLLFGEIAADSRRLGPLRQF